MGMSIKRFDNFGKGLEIKFLKKSSYKTKIGGFIGILLGIAILAYGSFEFLKLVTRSDPAIITSKTMIDLNMADHVSLREKGFHLMGTIFKVLKNE